MILRESIAANSREGKFQFRLRQNTPVPLPMPKGGPAPIPLPKGGPAPEPKQIEKKKEQKEKNSRPVDLALGLAQHLRAFTATIQRKVGQDALVLHYPMFLDALDIPDVTFSAGLILACQRSRHIHFSMKDMTYEGRRGFRNYYDSIVGGLDALGHELTPANIANLGNPPDNNYTNFELLVTLLAYQHKTTYYDDQDQERDAPVDWLMRLEYV